MDIWIYLNGMQQGPYTLGQLQMMNLDPATPVWYDGLPQWMPASQAPATASLFGFGTAYQPQSQAEAPTGAERPKKPNTYLVWNVILTVMCCCPTSLIGIITGAMSSSKYTAGDYDGAKKMSEITEWMLIIGIVWAVLSMPVAVAMSLL